MPQLSKFERYFFKSNLLLFLNVYILILCVFCWSLALSITSSWLFVYSLNPFNPVLPSASENTQVNTATGTYCYIPIHFVTFWSSNGPYGVILTVGESLHQNLLDEICKAQVPVSWWRLLAWKKNENLAGCDVAIPIVINHNYLVVSCWLSICGVLVTVEFEATRLERRLSRLILGWTGWTVGSA